MEIALGRTITKRKLTSLFKDNVKSAEAINLVYVTDTQEGISRISSGHGFTYKLKNHAVKDVKTLARIKSLVLPPAWKNVWICAKENGHLQATGIDARNRKQYKYHPLWNLLRNETKFHHLFEFGKVLPAIRRQLHKDLNRQGLPPEKVLAAIVSVMQCTCIRVGNSQYEKLYGSFGLTTLKDKHVDINGATVKFTFTGKKGVHHDIDLKSRRLANIVKQCRDIPGKELFQYYDEKGHRHPVDSGMVNNYIKEISGGHFTAKDFRTWAGTLHAITAFKKLGIPDTTTDTKKNVVTALDMVAKELGNTRTVCKKYYVHPRVISLYEDHSLDKFLSVTEDAKCSDQAGLSTEEQALMKILNNTGAASIAV
ncbi:MAG: topoisomerase [Flavipsychrobacter sp.]|nr:topoisomerase [Flavipsychrobacter sp.]